MKQLSSEPTAKSFLREIFLQGIFAKKFRKKLKSMTFSREII